MITLSAILDNLPPHEQIAELVKALAPLLKVNPDYLSGLLSHLIPPVAQKDACYVEEAAAQLSIHRTTFKRKYLDSGRIEKNDDGRIWVSDLTRVHDEELEKRRKAIAKLNRRAA